MTVAHIAAIYCLIGLVLSFGMWLVYDARSARVWREQRRSRVYHCIKCDCIFEAPAVQRVAPCPQCGFENSHLQF